jgi:hypothetical protein
MPVTRVQFNSRGFFPPFVRTLAAGIFFSILAQAQIPTSVSEQELPGSPKGTRHTYWLAPYCSVNESHIGQNNSTLVNWFTHEGMVRRRLVVNRIEPGFVTTEARRIPNVIAQKLPYSRRLEQLTYRMILYGVNEDWKIALASEFDPAGYITSTADSRTLVHEFHQRSGEISFSIYLHGKYVRSFGPFGQYLSEGVHLNDDGSIGVLIGSGKASPNPKLVVIGPNGDLKFRVDCADFACCPIVAPLGVGALLRRSDGILPNTWYFYTRVGCTRSLDIGPNPECVGWVPDSSKALISNSIGFGRRYSLIDWATGIRIWEIPCPGNGHPLAVDLGREMVLFAVAEPYKSGAWRGTPWLLGAGAWIRTFYALSLEDGRTIASWRAEIPSQLAFNGDERFVRLDEKLFYLTPDTVVELLSENIKSKRAGWR